MTNIEIIDFIEETYKPLSVVEVKIDGERIVIYAEKPGHVIGKKGSNIKVLSNILKKSFNIKEPKISVLSSEKRTVDE